MNIFRKIKFVFIFLSIVLLFFIGRRAAFSISHVCGQAASCALYPVLLFQQKIITPVKYYLEQRKNIKDLQEELLRAKKENEQLHAQIIALKSEATYYQNIKELLDFRKRYDSHSAVVGHIIFKHISEQAHYVLVNQGAAHGIETGMVAVYNNCLVGKVEEVYPWYCKVVTITDRSCKVAGYCESTKSAGIHVGSNQLSLTSLERVSHLEKVNDGDLILSSGEGLVFPQGFALGRIKEQKKEGLWYQIGVEPLIDLSKLSYCMFISKTVTS